ncbi:rod shape-determining protein [Anaerocolumna sp. MB42-C2]|uniref:rod shape-determining protein n=1 Tax=Anaerocolumna sp. MB42-C2 TaxID=3070997 RepID=UPI0027E1DC5C|nr:rod shape-determining protein [Anaerocolumna sp. MB42-C2]WMJ88262.1 rod shape-determining protein [Anaerocolumna sp. MB42-C2]
MAGKVYGIDFGTSTIKIYHKNDGIILDEKNMIAVANRKQVIAAGNEAFEMYEKAPSNIYVSYPVKNGVIADIANMLELLNYMIRKINKKSKKLSAVAVIVATPSDITEVEKRAFFDLVASSNFKAKNIKIVEKPIADAIGIGLDVTNAKGVMVVDIGADTTEVSIMSLGGIVISKLIPIGGNRLDESIKSYVKKNYNLVIGDKTSEGIKKELASALPMEDNSIKVYGRNVVTGLPAEVEINSASVYESITEYLSTIVDAIRIILERTPPEISSDIIDSGIFVTGGSASISGLDKLIAKETGLNVNICKDATDTVVNGLGKIIEDKKLFSLACSLKQTNFSG